MTALDRLHAALDASTATTVEVISADVNEVCKLCSPDDKRIAELAKAHPRGQRELHPISKSDLTYLLEEAE